MASGLVEKLEIFTLLSCLEFFLIQGLALNISTCVTLHNVPNIRECCDGPCDWGNLEVYSSVESFLYQATYAEIIVPEPKPWKTNSSCIWKPGVWAQGFLTISPQVRL